jgi:uncharacterized SAM-dependent methyltransferase
MKVMYLAPQATHQAMRYVPSQISDRIRRETANGIDEEHAAFSHSPEPGPLCGTSSGI